MFPLSPVGLTSVPAGSLKASSLQGGVSPLFSGTGENGKIRLVVARKEDRIEDTLQLMRDNPLVELVGQASSPRELERLIREEKPDVAVIGSTFGFTQTPLGVIQKLLDDHVLPKLGVVLHSVMEPNQIPGITWAHHLLTTGQERTQWTPYHFVSAMFDMKRGPQGEIDDMNAAIVAADPYPTGNESS